MRPIIIGQAPSSLSDPNEPLSGRSGRRLAELAGLSVEEFCETFERRNLIVRGPFKPLQAALCAAALLPVVKGRTVVLLGPAVARAFNLKLDPLDWSFPFGCGTVVGMCPHPSGRNRFWNYVENVERARLFWTILVRATQLTAKSRDA